MNKLCEIERILSKYAIAVIPLDKVLIKYTQKYGNSTVMSFKVLKYYQPHTTDKTKKHTTNPELRPTFSNDPISATTFSAVTALNTLSHIHFKIISNVSINYCYEI